MDDRLRRQLEFLIELDKAKSVYRRSYVTAEARNENDAEHMWHLAMFVLVLAEHAAEPVDVLHALKLVLVHDIVEIDAGDVFVYDEAAAEQKAELEQAAADRIYALLPDDQRDELRALWEEFEAKETPEARFAGSVDRLAPLLLNHATKGRSWREHGITSDRVRDLNRRIDAGSPLLWAAAQEAIDDAVAKGYLEP
ncbi:MAG TPA: HD domain-containing protein [Acidimicrobiales bacterium]|jgi:putative hydrolases of HD superfamily|nr:HD domain-containing protein [Acidimicrobiales bacterium]